MSDQPQRFSTNESHRARQMAESFGIDPDRYDRTRPRYPEATVERIIEASPGRDVLDVGTGTGVAARQFQAAGCRVLGVDVDARMAGFARRTGLAVEVAMFEEWDPAGRTFDTVIAGQARHWVDPLAPRSMRRQLLDRVHHHSGYRSADGLTIEMWWVGEEASSMPGRHAHNHFNG